MELVFEPDLETGEEAAALVKELMLILQRLGTCSCKMEGKQMAVMWIRLRCQIRTVTGQTVFLLTMRSTVLLKKPVGSQLVKKFTCILWNLEVRYHFHNGLPPVPILS